MTEISFGIQVDAQTTCDSCGRIVLGSELVSIRDAHERLDPGAEIPAGACPHCEALCYLVIADPPDSKEGES